MNLCKNFYRHEAEFLKRGNKATLTLDNGPPQESEVARAADLRAKTTNLYIGNLIFYF